MKVVWQGSAGYACLTRGNNPEIGHKLSWEFHSSICMRKILLTTAVLYSTKWSGDLVQSFIIPTWWLSIPSWLEIGIWGKRCHHFDYDFREYQEDVKSRLKLPSGMGNIVKDLFAFSMLLRVLTPSDLHGDNGSYHKRLKIKVEKVNAR